MEEWADILGFKNFAVSTLGRVKNKKTGTIRKQQINKGRYPQVVIYNGKNRTKTIHTLVLETFIGPRPDGMECRHLNGDKTDNRLANLAWGTPKENAQDKIKHCVQMRGSGIYCAILDEQKVTVIKFLLHVGISQSDIGKFFGISHKQIHKISKGITWKHVKGFE